MQIRKSLAYSSSGAGLLERATEFIIRNLEEPEHWWADLRSPSNIADTISRDQNVIVARRGRLGVGETVIALLGPQQYTPYNADAMSEDQWRPGKIEQVLEGGVMCYVVALFSGEKRYAPSEASVRRVGQLKEGTEVQISREGEWVNGIVKSRVEQLDPILQVNGPAYCSPALYTIDCSSEHTEELVQVS